MSVSLFSEAENIQMSGPRNPTASKIIRMSLPVVPASCAGPRSSTRVGAAVGSATTLLCVVVTSDPLIVGSTGRCRWFSSVDPPPLPQFELEQRDQTDDQEQAPCHGGGISELSEYERVLVQVVDVDVRRVPRAALRHHEDDREDLERGDELRDHYEEDLWGQQR